MEPLFLLRDPRPVRLFPGLDSALVSGFNYRPLPIIFLIDSHALKPMGELQLGLSLVPEALRRGSHQRPPSGEQDHRADSHRHGDTKEAEPDDNPNQAKPR